MKNIYYLKSRPRLFIVSTIFITVLVIVTNVLLQDYGSWRMERVFITLLPVFFTANVISDEYEQKRAGLLFVTNTPVYKQAAIKFIYGWLFTQVFIFLMFISAYATGMEPDFTRWFVLLIYSTYLSLIGLTVSNTTKQSLIGFGAALMYWIVMLTMGFYLNERLWPISIILNNDLSVQLVWGNLASLLGISYILILFNIWFIGKGEGIRKRITTINAVLLLAVLVMVGVYGYIEKQKAEAPYRVINAQTNETIVLIDTDDPAVIEEFDKRNIAYVIPDAVTEAELSEHDIILVTSGEDASDSVMVTKLLSESNISVDERGVHTGDKGIYNADAYRVILSNSLDTSKDVVHLHSRHWTQQGIAHLLDAKSGDFIALKQGVQVASSNYSVKNIDSLDKHLALSSDAEAWFIKGNDEAKLLYQNLSEAKANEFLTLWEKISFHLHKILPETIYVDTLQITNEPDGGIEDLESPSIIEINYRTLKELEPNKFGGRDWLEKIAISTLSQTIFHNIEDKELQYTWSQYIFLNKFGPALETEIQEDYWHNNYEFTLTEKAQGLSEESEYFWGNQELLNGGNANSIMYYLLRKLDSKGINMDSLLREVMLAPNQLDARGLTVLLAKYLPKAEIEAIFEVYHNASS